MYTIVYYYIHQFLYFFLPKFAGGKPNLQKVVSVLKKKKKERTDWLEIGVS